MLKSRKKYSIASVSIFVLESNDMKIVDKTTKGSKDNKRNSELHGMAESIQTKLETLIGKGCVKEDDEFLTKG